MGKKVFNNLTLWGLILILWIGFLCLGYSGWAQYKSMNHQANDIALDIYLTIQLVLMNSEALPQPIPLALNIARFGLPILTFLTAIQAFVGLFKDQVRAIRLAVIREHVIICGLSRKGLLLATRFHQQGKQVVVIEQDEDNPWIEVCRNMGMFTLIGDASEPAMLLNGGLQRSCGLFAVCDEDGVNADIAMNAKVLLNHAHPLRKSHTGWRQGRSKESQEDAPFSILMHNASPQLVGLLHQFGLHQADSTVRIIPFNVYERAVFQLLNQYPAWEQEWVESENVPRAFRGKEPHTLLIGLGRMGENIILHAAEKWAAHRTVPAARLHFTVLDHKALEKVESLEVRYPDLMDRCVLSPLQMEINSADFERGAFLFNSQGGLDIDHIYICIDNDSLGLHAGLMLRLRLPEGVEIPIVIRMCEETGLARLLEDHRNQLGKYRSLEAFGYLDHTCTPELLK